MGPGRGRHRHRRWQQAGRFGARWAAALLALVAGAGAVRAEFTICNQSFDVVNVAIGEAGGGLAYGGGEEFVTRGWWTIGTNQCANVIREELVNRYIYVYAADVFGQPILDGSVPMCIGPRAFEVRGIEECWQRGHAEALFFEVDTRAVARWTLFLTQRGLD